MRKFKLVNGEGTSYNLCERKSFFHSVSGLGYTDNTQFEKIGTDFHPLENRFSQGNIEGAIFFSGTGAYQEYRAFAKFVRSNPLTLVYQMDETYRVPVRLVSIEKSELLMGGCGLNCEVSFVTTGLYYRTVSKYADTLAIGGKVYPYDYSYVYADVSPNTVLINSDSYEDSPCKITICGPCIKPVWKHYVNNILYETGAYSGSIAADHKLVIDSTSVPYSIRELGAGNNLVADRYQVCDFATERFFSLQYGSNRISVSHDGINQLNIIVEGKISYETI